MNNELNDSLYCLEGANLADLVDNTLYNQCDYYTYELLNELAFNQGDFKILHFTVRSLQSKINQINHLLKHDIDIILLCETFMNNLNINKCKINGYTLNEYAYRENSKCGGVAIYTKISLKAIARTDLKLFIEGRIETCFIELISGCKNNNIVVGEIYWVPGTNERDFIDDYKHLLQNII